MKPIPKKIKNIYRLLKIVRNLKSSDMLFLYENLNQPAKTLLCELIYNVMYNTSCLKLSERQVKHIKKMLSPHKKDFEYIAKRSGTVCKKRRIMKKQIGTGVVTGLLAVLAPIIINLIADKLK